MMVTGIVTAAVVVKASVAATKKILHEALDFAFLDVNVTDGKTFEVAQILERKHVPFAFISGSPQEQLPSELHSVPFIPKPCYPAQIECVLHCVVTLLKEEHENSASRIFSNDRDCLVPHVHSRRTIGSVCLCTA
jgi:two-component SAPR family response regulator